MATGFGGVVAKFGADVTDFSTGIRKMTSESASFASHLGNVTGQVTGGFRSMLRSTVAFATGQAVFSLAARSVSFFGDQLHAVIEEAQNAQEELSQTNAILKSTGGISGMTAKAITDLATRFSHLTKFTDDEVQIGENMLLTFTNIGKNIFPQATEAMLNMSQVMGQDTKNSAIMLGKALQDPLTGMTALRRVGIILSAAQQQQIKDFMAVNNIAGAQRIILKELQREFGGTALAAGKTFAGQLAIARQSLDDIRQSIGDALIPVLSDLVSWLNKEVMPQLVAFSDWFATKAIPAIARFAEHLEPLVNTTLKNLVAFLSPVIAYVGQLATAFQGGSTALMRFSPLFGIIGQVIGDITPYLPGLRTTFSSLATTFLDFARARAEVIFQTIGLVMGDLAPLLPTVASAFSRISTSLMDAAAPVIDSAFRSLGKVVDAIAPELPGLVDAFAGLASAFLEMSGTALQEMLPIIETALRNILPPAIELATDLMNMATTILRFLMPAVRPLVDLLMLTAGGFLAVKAATLGWGLVTFIQGIAHLVTLLPTATGVLILNTVEIWNNVRAWIALKATQIGSFFSGLVSVLPGVTAGLTGAGTAASGAAIGFGALNLAMLGVVGVVGLVAAALVGLGVVVVNNVQAAHDHATVLATDLRAKWLQELSTMDMQSPQIVASMRDKMFLEFVRTGAMTRDAAWKASNDIIAEAQRGADGSTNAWKIALDTLPTEIKGRLDGVSGVYQQWIATSNGTWAQYWTDFKNQAINAQSLWAQSVERGLSQEQQDEIGMMTRHAADVQRSMGQWGADQVIAYATGMSSQEIKVMNATERIGTIVSERLAHSSPTAGPLVGDNQWMPDFVTMLAGGITRTTPVLTSAFTSLLQQLQGASTRVTSSILGTFARAWVSLRDGLTSGWNGITGALVGAADRMIYVLNQGLSGIESFVNHIVDAVDWIAGKLGAGAPLSHVGIGRVPYLAKGTDYWQGGVAMVGERGPELAYLPRGTQVADAKKTKSIVNGGITPRPIMGLASGIGDIFDFILDWLSGGVSNITSKLFSQFNVNLPMPGVLSGVGGAITDKAKGWVGDYVGSLIEKTFGTLTFASGLPTQVPMGKFILPPGGGFHNQMWYGVHQGMDFQFPQGSLLREVIGGMVWPTTGWKPWGGELDVKTAMGLTERYEHLSAIFAQPGQFVRRGDPVGLTGGGTPESGLGYWSTGAHLHYQLDPGYYSGGINPLSVWAALGLFHPFLFDHGGILNEKVMGIGASSHKPYLFGESGPEAVMPLGSGSAPGRAAGASGGVTENHFHIYLDGREVSQATAPHIVKSMRTRTGVRV